ncbi:unnamed protein product [Dovyalis caffra]|uniref:Cellulose synthase-like protein G2 n=1 Tax=Dovyalis caffra TaxID=77055 RepID=A0AAV1QZY3_9ROSI|nr:unnamed protein product [Dovyalis caffra]
MENSSPLNTCHARFHKLYIIIHWFHAVIHCTAITFLVYYRVSFLFQDPQTRATPVVPWLLVFASELLLSFMWLLGQAYRWRPVSRTVFLENLPEDDKLPAIDVFICTVDPNKEPTVGVMNTVLSAMALDYPAEKTHVYLSDDGGASITLVGMREACRFGRWWLPFCRKYGIKTRCPQAYFSDANDEDKHRWSSKEFIAEREIIKEKYEKFQEVIQRSPEKDFLEEPSTSNSRDHPAVIEVINESCSETMGEDQVQMPLLVYVSREKSHSHPHHFKAGALNALLRVSGLISNSPYILVLDCDMYCNGPSSARQAMCFHLDPKISPSLASVFFPQKFHNISDNDIYDSEIRQIFTLNWYGSDGLRGPIWSGTNCYIKRESLYGDSLQEGSELEELKKAFGPSNELIKSLKISGIISGGESSSTFLQETKFLASSTYEDHTTWGKEARSLRNMRNEQRIWMIKSVTSHLYGSLDAITKRLGLRKASFLLTNKVADNEQLCLGFTPYAFFLQQGLSQPNGRVVDNK